MLLDAECFELGNDIIYLCEVFCYPEALKFELHVFNLFGHVHCHKFLGFAGVACHCIPNFVSETNAISVYDVSCYEHISGLERVYERKEYGIVSRSEAVEVGWIVKKCFTFTGKTFVPGFTNGLYVLIRGCVIEDKIVGAAFVLHEVDVAGMREKWGLKFAGN